MRAEENENNVFRFSLAEQHPVFAQAKILRNTGVQTDFFVNRILQHIGNISVYSHINSKIKKKNIQNKKNITIKMTTCRVDALNLSPIYKKRKYN